jgi:hypothetical protein
MELSDAIGLRPLRCIVVAASLLAPAAAPDVAQSPSRDAQLADVHQRIEALNGRFVEIRNAAQQQLDAANCRVNCPPEVSQRIVEEMATALDRITASIHAEVDSFILSTVDRNGGRVDIPRLQSALACACTRTTEGAFGRFGCLKTSGATSRFRSRTKALSSKATITENRERDMTSTYSSAMA